MGLHDHVHFDKAEQRGVAGRADAWSVGLGTPRAGQRRRALALAAAPQGERAAEDLIAGMEDIAERAGLPPPAAAAMSRGSAGRISV